MSSRPISILVQGLLGYEMRFSDAASSPVLAEHFRGQAEMCQQMAGVTVSPFKEGWLEFAAEWTKLAQDADIQQRE